MVKCAQCKKKIKKGVLTRLCGKMLAYFCDKAHALDFVEKIVPGFMHKKIVYIPWELSSEEYADSVVDLGFKVVIK